MRMESVESPPAESPPTLEDSAAGIIQFGEDADYKLSDEIKYIKRRIFQSNRTCELLMNHRGQVDRYQKMYEEKEEECKRISEEKEKIMVQNKQLTASNNQIKLKIFKLEEIIELNKKTQQKYEKENNESQMENFTREIGEKKKEIIQLKNKINKIERENDESKLTITSQLSAYERKLKDYEQENRELKQKLGIKSPVARKRKNQQVSTPNKIKKKGLDLDTIDDLDGMTPFEENALKEFMLPEFPLIDEKPTPKVPTRDCSVNTDEIFKPKKHDKQVMTDEFYNTKDSLPPIEEPPRSTESLPSNLSINLSKVSTRDCSVNTDEIFKPKKHDKQVMTDEFYNTKENLPSIEEPPGSTESLPSNLSKVSTRDSSVNTDEIFKPKKHDKQVMTDEFYSINVNLSALVEESSLSNSSKIITTAPKNPTRDCSVNTVEIVKAKKVDKQIMTEEFYSTKDNVYPIFCSKCEKHIDILPVDTICKVMTTQPPPLLTRVPLSPMKRLRKSQNFHHNEVSTVENDAVTENRFETLERRVNVCERQLKNIDQSSSRNVVGSAQIDAVAEFLAKLGNLVTSDSFTSNLNNRKRKLSSLHDSDVEADLSVQNGFCSGGDFEHNSLVSSERTSTTCYKKNKLDSRVGQFNFQDNNDPTDFDQTVRMSEMDLSLDCSSRVEIENEVVRKRKKSNSAGTQSNLLKKVRNLKKNSSTLASKASNTINRDIGDDDACKKKTRVAHESRNNSSDTITESVAEKLNGKSVNSVKSLLEKRVSKSINKNLKNIVEQKKKFKPPVRMTKQIKPLKNSDKNIENINGVNENCLLEKTDKSQKIEENKNILENNITIESEEKDEKTIDSNCEPDNLEDQTRKNETLNSKVDESKSLPESSTDEASAKCPSEKKDDEKVDPEEVEEDKKQTVENTENETSKHNPQEKENKDPKESKTDNDKLVSEVSVKNKEKEQVLDTDCLPEEKTKNDSTTKNSEENEQDDDNNLVISDDDYSEIGDLQIVLSPANSPDPSLAEEDDQQDEKPEIILPQPDPPKTPEASGRNLRKRKQSISLTESPKKFCDSLKSRRPGTIGFFLDEYLKKHKANTATTTPAKNILLQKIASKYREEEEKFIKENLKNLINHPEWNVSHNQEIKLNLLNKSSDKLVAKCIVEILCEITENRVVLNKIFTPPAPLLTDNEQKIIAFLIDIETSMPEIITWIYKAIERTLFKLNDGPDTNVVSSLSRVYVTLSKIKRDRERVRIMCCDALYCLQKRASIVLHAVLTSWPEILPRYNSSKDQYLQCCIGHVVTANNHAEPKIKQTKRLIRDYYKYPLKSDDPLSKELTDKLVDAFVKKSDKYARTGILLLAKKLGTDWTYKNIINQRLLKIISDEKCTVIPDVIQLIGLLMKSFPKQDDGTVQNIIYQLRWLIEEGDTSPEVQESLISALLCLSRFQFPDIALTVLNWQPIKSPSPFLQEQLNSFYRARKPSVWAQIRNRPVRRDKKTFLTTSSTNNLITALHKKSL